MGRKAVWTLTLAAMVALGLPACYSLVEKPIVKSRKAMPTKEYMAPTKFIQVDNLNLAYLEAGEGPTVILIHGGMIPMNIISSLGRTPLSDIFRILYIPPRAQTYAHLGAVATIDTWKFNWDAMTKRFHVIALDLPGFGSSDKPKMKYRIEDFTRYLLGFMDAKKLDRASLVGLDIGGMIALNFVLTHPERVDKLVLINSEGTHNPWFNLIFTRIPYADQFVFLPIFQLWQNEKAAQINFWMPLYRHLFAKHAIRNVLHDQSEGISRNFIYKDEGTSKEFMDQVIDYKMNYLKSNDFTKEVHALHKTLMNIKRRDLRLKIVRGLETIQAPTLIIWGLENPRPKMNTRKTSGEAELLDQAIPNSYLSVFNQSGRFPMAEEPEAFNAQVIQFLGIQSNPEPVKSQ